MKKNNLRKKAATAGSAALVAALLLTGTYAWNSISQEALNEDVTYSNPGGRLHDDWAGIADGTKNVYVENFNESGKAIYARVKLQTYIESGEDAGKTVDENGKPLEKRAATPLVNGTTIDKKETWPTYTFGEGGVNPEIANYLEIKDGVKKKVNYMPTFNKNLESLMADINGTYQGVDGVHFGDYVDYTKAENQKKTGVAYYYSENGTAADGGVTAPGTDKNYETKNEEHTVQATLETAKIISMEEWLGYDGVSAGQEKAGNYWVYDEDGWFYWAQAIESQTATGPLITGVEQLKEMRENCYIGINVVGEFADAGDWGDENGGTDAELGFYKNGITENALELLNKVSGIVPDRVSITNSDSVVKMLPGDKKEFEALVATKTSEGKYVECKNSDLEWSVSGATKAGTTIDEDGNLTIAADEAMGTVLTVTVTSAARDSVKETVDVVLSKSKLPADVVKGICTTKVTEDGVLEEGGATNSVVIDGVPFYVLAKKDGKALLLTAQRLKEGQFSAGGAKWPDSDARKYLNGEWLANKAMLSACALETKLYTNKEFDDTTLEETTDKIFFLSRGDIFGDAENGAKTYALTKMVNGEEEGVCLVAPNGSWKMTYRWWLRNPYTTSYRAAIVEKWGALGQSAFSNKSAYRPACWGEY